MHSGIIPKRWLLPERPATAKRVPRLMFSRSSPTARLKREILSKPNVSSISWIGITRDGAKIFGSPSAVYWRTVVGVLEQLYLFRKALLRKRAYTTRNSGLKL